MLANNVGRKSGRYTVNLEIEDIPDLDRGRLIYTFNPFVDDDLLLFQKDAESQTDPSNDDELFTQEIVESIRSELLKLTAQGREDLRSLNSTLTEMFDDLFPTLISELSNPSFTLGQRKVVLDLAEFVLGLLGNLKSFPFTLIERELYLKYSALLQDIRVLLSSLGDFSLFKKVLSSLNGHCHPPLCFDLSNLSLFFKEQWGRVSNLEKQEECLHFVCNLLNSLSMENFLLKSNEITAAMNCLQISQFCPKLRTSSDRFIFGMVLANRVLRVVTDTKMLDKIKTIGRLLTLITTANRSMLVVVLASLSNSVLSYGENPEKHANVFRLLAVMAQSSVDLFQEEALMAWFKGVVRDIRLPPILLSIFEEVDTSDKWFYDFALELAEELSDIDCDGDSLEAYYKDKLINLLIEILE